MYLVFAALRLLPFWALPMALVFGQLGLHFRRRKSSVQWSCWAMVSLLCLSAVLWVVFRGDLHSDEWLRALLG